MSSTQPTLEDAEQNAESLRYKCPQCDVSYEHEILTRTHITRSEDPGHLNHNGFMPEEEIQVINEDGDVVDTLSKERADINFDDLSFEDVSDDYSDQHKAIILAGAYNPDETDYKNSDGTGLTSAAHEIMNEHGLETVSYSTVRRVLRNFYRPQEVEAEKKAKEESNDDNDEERLSDLTATQQAIIITKLAHPDEGDTKLAERANDTSTSYPRQVYADRGAEVYNRLKSKVDEGTDVEDAVLEELTAEDLEELEEHGFDLGVDLTGAIAEAAESSGEEDVYDLGVGEQKEAMSASPFDTGSDETETWGAEESTEETDATEDLDELEEPATNVRTAQETDTEQDETTSTDEPTEPETTTEPEPEPEAETVTEETEEPAEAVSETAEASASEGIPREDVRSLQEKVEWFVEVTEEETESEARDRQLAFANQVNDELEELLDGE